MARLTTRRDDSETACHWLIVSICRGDRLDILATLIDVYETKHDPMDPVEAIHFPMGRQDITQKDREPMISRAIGRRMF